MSCSSAHFAAAIRADESNAAAIRTQFTVLILIRAVIGRSGADSGLLGDRARSRASAPGARRSGALRAANLAASVGPDQADAGSVRAQLAIVVEVVDLERAGLVVAERLLHAAVARIHDGRCSDRAAHLAAPIRPDEADAGAVGAELPPGRFEVIFCHESPWG